MLQPERQPMPGFTHSGALEHRLLNRIQLEPKDRSIIAIIDGRQLIATLHVEVTDSRTVLESIQTT